MSAPVLLPKIRLPRRSTGTLSRRRLLDSIHQDLDRRLFMVVAPAGYGKTTLLADFAADVSFPVCWYTLGPEDRDLKVFLLHLVASIQACFPSYGSQTRALLNRARDVQREMTTLVASLVNEIFTDVGDPFALVLDDFQAVDDSPSINQAMDELIRYLPDNCRVLLASRTVPRLNFTHLAARLQVAGLGTNELRFTGEEVRRLLKERHRVLMMPDQADKLAEESEGWITGILLTTHSLWRGLLETLTRAKGAGGPFVYDYLADEVLAQQPDEMREHLYLSSVQPQTSPQQLEALVGPGPWAQLLERAEADGLFLDRLQGDEAWFRYHNLFREFLQQRFAAADPGRYQSLHLRAAKLAAQQDELATAFEHFHRAGEDARSAELLEERLDSLVEGGTWRQIADLVDELPDEIRQQHVRLRLFRGHAGFWLGDLTTAEGIADDLAEQAQGLERARALLLRGNVRRFLGRLADAEADLSLAGQLSSGDAGISAEAEMLLGICNGLRGDLDRSTRHLGRSLPLYEASGNVHNLAQARYNLGVTCSRRGALDDAFTNFRAALDVWERLGDDFSSAETLLGLGNLHMVRGQYGEAVKVLERALALARGVGYVRLQASVLDSLAAVHRAQGDAARAVSGCEEGLQLARRLGESALLSTLLDGLANSWRMSGDLEKAESLALQAQRLAQEHESQFDAGISGSTLGSIALARGDNRGALTHFRGARTLLSRAGARRDLARARLRLAQAYWRLGDRQAARREAKAVTLALRTGGQYGLLAPEAAELTAPLEAAQVESPTPELARLLDLARRPVDLIQPTTLLTSVRTVETAAWPEVRLCSIGPPRVECGGRLVSDHEWRSSKALELFCYLAANPPEATTEQIITALWPDSSQAKGQTNLWSSVYRVRQAIHSEVLVKRRGVYALNASLPLYDDAVEFERLVTQADEVDGAERIAVLRRAVQLYRGPYLDGVYSEWCDHRRRALEERYLLALTTLVQLSTTNGSYGQALDYAQRILALDPYHEDAHCHVIRLHGLLSDREGGVRHYQRYVELLSSDLGEQPSERARLAYLEHLRSTAALA